MRQGHADAELGRAPRHRIRKDAEQAEAGQPERQRAEAGGQEYDDAFLAEAGADPLIDPADGSDWHIRSSLADRLSNRGNRVCRLTLGPDLDDASDDRPLLQRKERGWHGPVLHVQQARIVHDAHDFDVRPRLTEMPAKRVSVFEIPRGKRPVDDGDAWTLRPIVIRERAVRRGDVCPSSRSSSDRLN